MDSIFHRTSVRKFKSKEVKKDKILQVLRAGMQAPSAGNQQPWEFYVVTNKKTIEELSKTSPYAGCSANAPVVIVSVYRKDGLMFPEYAEIDMSIAQENIWLEADNLGLGGVWLGIAPLKERMNAVSKILNLPKILIPFSLFPMGYPAETHEQQNRFEETRIHFID